MKKADFKTKTEKELAELLREKRAALQDLRFKVQDGQLKNVRSIRVLRKEIAQILTCLQNTQLVIS